LLQHLLVALEYCVMMPMPSMRSHREKSQHLTSQILIVNAYLPWREQSAPESCELLSMPLEPRQAQLPPITSPQLRLWSLLGMAKGR
jgi:hypothetical protein